MENFRYYRIVNDNGVDQYYVPYSNGVNVWKEPAKRFSWTESLEGFVFDEVENILKFVNVGSNVIEIFLPVTDPDFKLIRDTITNTIQATKIIVGKKYDLSNFDVFKMLVEQGANIHASNDLPLEWACRCGHLDIVAYIIEQGGDMHVTDGRFLQTAGEYDHLDIIKFLVSKGAKLDTIGDKMLINEIHKGHTDIVKYLIENSVSVHGDARLQNGKNDPMKTACFYGKLDIVKLLWEHGADIKTDSGPLRYACSQDHFEIVKFLIEKGSRVYDKTNPSYDGEHVLIWAKNRPVIFEYLCERLTFTHE
jgi:hypothetical protein